MKHKCFLFKLMSKPKKAKNYKEIKEACEKLAKEINELFKSK